MDELEVDILSEHPFINIHFADFEESIELLGGTLTEDQKLKIEKATEHKNRILKKLEAEGVNLNELPESRYNEEPVKEKIPELAETEKPESPKPPKKIKRNGPCWCGSGTKYKKCCMKKDK